MSWLYSGALFKDKHIPENAIGFVYEMTAIIDGRMVSYIGKKNFYATTKKKLSKKMISTDKRKKTYVRVSKLAYQDYYSSNETLKKAHKEGVKIKRDILRICYSKSELTYYEVKKQFEYEVLEHDYFLNGNILGRFFKQHKV